MIAALIVACVAALWAINIVIGSLVNPGAAFASGSFVTAGILALLGLCALASFATAHLVGAL